MECKYKKMHKNESISQNEATQFCNKIMLVSIDAQSNDKKILKTLLDMSFSDVVKYSNESRYEKC